ncbi:aspartyl aminopeptidase [Auriculariales sp. MPI-PUGE-AT-0066]|nr:aspartyl aminopeptidase [Auriculariales sp. MPI-PUGE-AT-0066]
MIALRVRPISNRTKEGYLQVGVETYGGGIWHTWFDRDLSVAGRVIVSDGAGGFAAKLVQVDKPILRIPSLAIHLDRNVNSSFGPNLETHLIPILGMAGATLNKTSAAGAGSTKPSHQPGLMALLAGQVSCKPEEIFEIDLSLYDTQPATIGGLDSEFIFSPRMDNQFSSFCAVDALINSVSNGPTGGATNAIVLFNHEEIGSGSTIGAQSDLVDLLVGRLDADRSKSFIISSDMGHAVHPSYKDKHQDEHKPLINQGVVIKTNASQRYATDSIGSFLVRRLVEKRGGRVQQFEVRNDMPCGSTVGPMLSSRTGIRTVDVGCAMLSMHSIRETAGTADVDSMINLFEEFFVGFTELDASLIVE